MPFVALTPNPAIDRTLDLDGPLVPGRLHRVHSVVETAGGKGVNVARVLAALGARVVVAGFLAGFNGGKFRRLLEDDGLDGVFQEVEGETRESHIALGPGHPTEINEPGPYVSEANWRALISRLPAGPEWQYVVSGSLPGGLSPEAFRRLLLELPTAPVVDSRGPALSSALAAGVALVKPNRAEIGSLMPLRGDGIAESVTLFRSHGVPLLVTLGADGAAYVGDRVYRQAAPAVAVVNPVGSGDSLLAAFLWARAEGWDVADSLRLGVAAGTENAAAGGGARLTRDGIFSRFESMVTDSGRE